MALLVLVSKAQIASLEALSQVQENKWLHPMKYLIQPDFPNLILADWT
jgi:hypothetical protein